MVEQKQNTEDTVKKNVLFFSGANFVKMGKSHRNNTFKREKDTSRFD